MLPRVSLLEGERKVLNEWCQAQGATEYAERQSSAKKREDASAYLIEGLYQAWCCVSPCTPLEIPLHSSSYHSKRSGLINHLSHQYVELAVKGLSTLGWVRIKKGYRRSNGKDVLTTLWPVGGLLQRFEEVGLCWQELKPPKSGIVLRNTVKGKKAKINLRVPDTAAVRKMQTRLNKINRFLAQQAICLHLSNDRMKALGGPNSQIGFPLIFTHTTLRRVFSKGSLEMGGRFYGGWWEGLPSEYRPYLTINGHATGEIDFSELHPRLLYLLSGQDVPEGDLYDDGWRDSNSTIYDKSIEPYKSRRNLLKTVFNALLNDEDKGYRLEKHECAVAKRFGLNLPKIRIILFRKHPLLEQNAYSGIGLRLQYVDSQIAEKVMLDLLSLAIPCLPVHDSFLVPRHQGAELVRAMNIAFNAVTGHDPKLKDMEPFHSDFRLTFNSSGDVDKDAMREMYRGAIHDRFVESRWMRIER
jgi:hypothetical protein